MSKRHYFFTVIVALLAGLVGAALLPKALDGKGGHENAAAHENAYERVMRTGTIRCGYVVWTPFLLKDPNTGEISGLFHDYVEALGAALKFKIEWTEEEGWGDFPAALNSGRIDVMCGGSWANSARAREIDFVRPILFQQTYAWVRADDHRYDNNIASVNDPAVTVTYVEGTTQQIIASQDFPRAKTFQLPELSSLADTFVGLVGGKADVALAATEAAHQFDLKNPGKIRRIDAKMPLRIFGNGLAVGGGQDRLRRMLDISTGELMASGRLDKLIAQYSLGPGVWLPVAPPYQLPQ